jgi:predicted amidophosphoribosyltransferase
MILVPIPLHSSRYRWRGFNQSASVGKYLAAKMGWDFVPDLLIRSGKTTPQVGLNKDERKDNVKSAFVINPIYLQPAGETPAGVHYSSFIVHNSIVLFDDVWTTGATMREAGKVLKMNGAKKVWGITIAN